MTATVAGTDHLATDQFVSALRAQSQRYHSLHPFHRRMNEGSLNSLPLSRPSRCAPRA